MPETLTFDVIIIGAGPAGLAASIRLAQLQPTLNICVIEKGSVIGAHSLSGAVLNPTVCNQLLPHWQQHYNGNLTAVTQDKFLWLTRKKAWRLPTPQPMKNMGHYIISLGQFVRMLAQEAEQLGINLLTGFAATTVLYENNTVVGVQIGDKGVTVKGEPKTNYQPGMQLLAKQIIFSEGCRGSLTQTLFKKFSLCKPASPQTYALGIKEIWEIPNHHHHKGLVAHTIGWPLDNQTYGGAFVYHWGENLLSIGLVVGLDYQNPYFNPYETFQQLKMHPTLYPILKTGRRIAYGARTLVEGGWQALPQLAFPGGMIIGDAAGFLNVPKMKGIHYAMQSGILAAEAIIEHLPTQTGAQTTCEAYEKHLKTHTLYRELYRARNIRPSMRWGLWKGLLYSAIDTYLFRGYAPWTLPHSKPDHQSLMLATQARPFSYPKHDNLVTFDLSASLYLANIQYDENQPYHLKLANRQLAIEVNLKQYASPETRYCPAGVYEITMHEPQKPRLLIHGGNCIHCKACDIKDPMQNITWTPSEGGSGPQYEMM